MKTRPLSSVGQRRVRVGRKAISCGRIVERIEMMSGQKDGDRSVFSFVMRLPWRRIGVVVLIIFILITVGTGGYSIYRTQQQARLDEQAKIEFEIEKAARQKRAACEADITQKSADKLGKVTYDQLYGDSCNQ